MLDEQALIAGARQGDDHAFASLVQSYEELAFRTAYLIVRDEAEAQDVAQEGFMRAYGSLHRFDAARPFRPWLLRIVTNLAINSRRSAQRREAATERYERHAGVAATLSPESAAVASAQSQRLWEAVGVLDENDQAVLYLRYFLDASEAETAEAIGRAPGTVKSRLHRALRRLRDVIDERFPDLRPGVAPQPEGGIEA